MSTEITGPGDLRDQHWLDAQVALLGDGIEAARNIWSNWYEGRCVGRLHPDQTPGEYIASLGFRLTLAEAMAALPDGSSREVATVAGVSHPTVLKARATPGNSLPPGEVLEAEEPPRVIGADGKSYPARVVQAVVIDEAPTQPVAVRPGEPLVRPMIRSFERELRRLRDEYAGLLNDRRAARFHPVLTAIEAALSKEGS